MSLRDFSDEDMAELAAVIKERKASRGNSKSTARAGDSFNENTDHQAPEVFMALTPTGGIPAIDGVIPGSAVCDLYRTTGAFGSETLEEMVGISKTVFNISATAIAADIYVLIKRTKQGKWVAETGGSGGDGSVSIWFTVDATGCDDIGRYLIVTPNRIAPPCTVVPGEDEYGLIYVYDDGFLCILNEFTNAELLGLNGKATYASDVDQSYGCLKGWTLDGLCDTGNC